MLSEYRADSAPLPFMPHDHAVKDYRRTTDRPAEHGPRAWTTFERVFWTLGGLVLVAFWVAVFVEIAGGVS